MTRLFLTLISLLLVSQVCLAQVGGGSVYNQNRQPSPQVNEREKRTITKDDMPPNGSMYLDASVMVNVKADEHVAMFGISEEGATLDECTQKMNATLLQFQEELKKLGVSAGSLFVDFIAQNRIYGFDIVGDVAREKLVGFELKKTISIHYKNKNLLDGYIAAAARAQIFDLIKVDYIVRDISAVETKLMEEAARVIKRKAANNERLLGIKTRQPAQVIAEKYTAYFPTEMYDSYTAFESEDVGTSYYRQKYTVQSARKNRTFYFNALDAKSFDHVTNPIVVEPVVQFTLYLKVKFTTANTVQKSDKGPVKLNKR